MPDIRVAVRTILAKLPAEQREVIELAYFGGLSHGDIAARLARPEALVKVQMRNGMAKLRELFNHMDVRI